MTVWGGGKIWSPLLHRMPVICPHVCWRRQEKRYNSALLHITRTMIKCLSGTLLPVSGSGEQLEAAVCCHAGIGTNSTPCCTAELFAQALQGGNCWSSGVLWQLVKVKTKSLSPWCLVCLLLAGLPGLPCTGHRGLCVTPRVMSWLCVGAALLFDSAEMQTFFSKVQNAAALKNPHSHPKSLLSP